MMSFDSIALVIDTYWIFLLAALLIGVATGWFASSTDAPASTVS